MADTASRELGGAVSGRTYKRTRVRGFAEWSPRAASRVLVDQVQEILTEYRDYLPMTARQVFYRLVGAHDYPKDERAYDRLIELLNRARRARLIPMESIRDDGATAAYAGGSSGPEEFKDTVRFMVERYARSLDQGQPRAIEVWVEAAGMVPMVARVARQYGADVFSSGGFESVTAKHTAADRIAYRDVPTSVLHIGDLDPSGWSIVDAAAEDVAEFVGQLGGEPPTVSRLAVTLDQVRRYSLPTAPQKATDRRGAHMTQTVQAEALPPDQLTTILTRALGRLVDQEALREVRARSERERAELLAWIDRA